MHLDGQAHLTHLAVYIVIVHSFDRPQLFYTSSNGSFNHTGHHRFTRLTLINQFVSTTYCFEQLVLRVIDHHLDACPHRRVVSSPIVEWPQLSHLSHHRQRRSRALIKSPRTMQSTRLLKLAPLDNDIVIIAFVINAFIKSSHQYAKDLNIATTSTIETIVATHFRPLASLRSSQNTRNSTLAKPPTYLVEWAIDVSGFRTTIQQFFNVIALYWQTLVYESFLQLHNSNNVNSSPFIGDISPNKAFASRIKTRFLNDLDDTSIYERNKSTFESIEIDIDNDRPRS